MKTYDYILLDWDGNLAHTLNLWPDALNEVLQKRGISLPREQLIAATWGFVAYVADHTKLTAKEAAEALAEANELVVSRSANIELFPGVTDTLRQLKASGKHLALITTSERRMVTPALTKFALTDLFDVIVTDDDIEKSQRKPHPKPLLMALTHMGGSPERAVMIGDRDKDIQAAHNAGMDSVLFCSPEHKKHYDINRLMQHNPTYAMSEFKELIKIAR